ncbi:hypothetical protein SELMODRAFT_417134 [Selaginella moellendorffii]|uniref:Uncharacterized protein n=1 Tax=Selaginella moellendorffii TaxID=88036 RepID=D8S1H0_SELML|nr:hypothetical protein SELMODRAFT_417134 [Selaginella moellendorffii]
MACTKTTSPSLRRCRRNFGASENPRYNYKGSSSTFGQEGVFCRPLREKLDRERSLPRRSAKRLSLFPNSVPAAVLSAHCLFTVQRRRMRQTGNEEVRVAILLSLGSSLRKAERNLPAECSSFFLAGLEYEAIPLVDQLVQLSKSVWSDLTTDEQNLKCKWKTEPFKLSFGTSHGICAVEARVTVRLQRFHHQMLSKAGCASLVPDPLYSTHFLIVFHHDWILCGLCKTLKYFIRAVLRSDPGAVWKVLAGANGLTSEQPAISKAAIFASGLVTHFIPDEMLNHLIHGVLSDLADWSSHNGLNDKVDYTHEDTMSKSVSRRLRLETRTRFTVVLRAIAAIADPALIPLVLPLLKSPIVSDEAFRTMVILTGLVTAVPRHLTKILVSLFSLQVYLDNEKGVIHTVITTGIIVEQVLFLTAYFVSCHGRVSKQHSSKETLSALFTLYSSGGNHVDPGWSGRQAYSNSDVRSKMVEAGVAVLDKHGKRWILRNLQKVCLNNLCNRRNMESAVEQPLDWPGCVIRILPEMLVCFSVSVSAVYEAADRTIMSQLTGQGVKLVLPALFKGLEDRAWRTKHGSVQLLGTMTFCAPRQLSQCFSEVICLAQGQNGSLKFSLFTRIVSEDSMENNQKATTSAQVASEFVRNDETAQTCLRIVRWLKSLVAKEKEDRCTVHVVVSDTAALMEMLETWTGFFPAERDDSSDIKQHEDELIGPCASHLTHTCSYSDSTKYIAEILRASLWCSVEVLEGVQALFGRLLGLLLMYMDQRFPFKQLMGFLNSFSLAAQCGRGCGRGRANKVGASINPYARADSGEAVIGEGPGLGVALGDAVIGEGPTSAAGDQVAVFNGVDISLHCRPIQEFSEEFVSIRRNNIETYNIKLVEFEQHGSGRMTRFSNQRALGSQQLDEDAYSVGGSTSTPQVSGSIECRPKLNMFAFPSDNDNKAWEWIECLEGEDWVDAEQLWQQALREDFLDEIYHETVEHIDQQLEKATTDILYSKLKIVVLAINTRVLADDANVAKNNIPGNGNILHDQMRHIERKCGLSAIFSILSGNLSDLSLLGLEPIITCSDDYGKSVEHCRGCLGILDLKIGYEANLKQQQRLLTKP